jgi:hypothetical protein
LVISNPERKAARVAAPTTEETSVGLGEPRSRTELVLEMIALRHQIAVLKRCRTRRPCFGVWDRLFWILLSWWWRRWPESLMIIQPETAKRWRRNGWLGCGGIGQVVAGEADVPGFLAKSAN